MKQDLAIVIFRNNLRIHDNPCLYHATQKHERVLGIYSHEINQGDYLGFEKCGKYRKSFIHQSLDNLQKNLIKYGINLSIVSSFETTLDQLSLLYNITVYFEHEVGTDENTIENIFKNIHITNIFTKHS